MKLNNLTNFEYMEYCKYCKIEIDRDKQTRHNCEKVGLLEINEDDSFILSTIIGRVTDSALLGGILGGDMIGGIFGDVLDGDLFD